MFGFTIAHVRGDSMSPRLHDGQVKLFRRRTYYQIGDIVLADHSRLGLIIKQIAGMTGGSVRLKGLNPHSISEADIGDLAVERIKGRLVGRAHKQNINAATQHLGNET
ncbi:MAG: S24/S26 family peptidase [Pseudomonadota bacterium]